MPGKKHFVHVFPSFGAGGVPIRIAAIVNHLGDRARHTIVALDGEAEAAGRIADGIDYEIRVPEINKKNPLSTLCRISGELRTLKPDLLLTFNWGSMEWAFVNRFFGRVRHVHFESGFGPEEKDTQIRRRVQFRRVALARTEKIVVPSHVLVRIVTDIWKLDPAKIELIPNGVDCDRFAAAPDPSLVPGLDALAGGGPVIGTVAPLRAEKNIGRMIEAFARLPEPTGARLLIVGDGPERPGLEALAQRRGVDGRTLFAGYVSAPEKVFGLIDLFAMSSDTEQMPNALLQAMAAGRPVVATDVGDIKPIVAEENRPYVAPRDDADAYLAAMTALASDAGLRETLGAANRQRAVDVYSFPRMAAAYERVLLA